MTEELWERLEDHARRAQDAATEVGAQAYHRDALASCRWINRVMEQLQEAAGAAGELAIREGHSQKKVADALGLPVSALRGAKREILGV